MGTIQQKIESRLDNAIKNDEQAYIPYLKIVVEKMSKIGSDISNEQAIIVIKECKHFVDQERLLES